MNFRKADKKDIPQLLLMRLAYLSEDHGGLAEEERKVLESRLEPYFEEYLNQDLIVFLAEEGKVQSTVFLLLNRVPPNPAFPTGRTGTLLNVYTNPDYRKQGIAMKLIEMAIDEGRKRELDFIDLQSTEMGYRLYQKVGFVDTNSKYTSMKLQY